MKAVQTRCPQKALAVSRRIRRMFKTATQVAIGKRPKLRALSAARLVRLLLVGQATVALVDSFSHLGEEHAQ